MAGMVSVGISGGHGWDGFEFTTWGRVGVWPLEKKVTFVHKSLIIIVYTDFRSSFIMCIYYIYNTYSHRNISTCRSRAKEKNTVPLATGQIIVFLMDTTKPVNRFLARFDVSFSLLIVIHVAVQVSCFSKNLQCVRGEVSLVKKSVAIPERTLGRPSHSQVERKPRGASGPSFRNRGYHFGNPKIITGELWSMGTSMVWDSHMAVCQNLVPLVNIKIAGKWMFIPLKMVLIGIDPYPYYIF